MHEAKEMKLLSEIRLALAEHNIITFRCNVGKVKMADGRWFDTGLPPGHSDLSGVLPGGRALFIECKVKPRKPTKQQQAFIAAMLKQGATAGVAYTVDDALAIAGLIF